MAAVTIRKWRERLFGKTDGAFLRSTGGSLPPPHPTLPIEGRAFAAAAVGLVAFTLGACATLPSGTGVWGPAGCSDVVITPTVAEVVDGQRCPSRPADVAAMSAHSEMLLPASERSNSLVAVAPAIRWTDQQEEDRVARRGAGGLFGVPILLKDNIETADMPTTAGSLALVDNAPGRDAPLVTRLRDAGAVILGKANLSEWANIRSSQSISGWSAIGGQTRNPYDPERTPCGSSSGSAVAVAIGLAPAAIGTETDGSITCPASVNGVVGFKPTVGLVSRTHIVPIAHSQDTAGPITTTVEDAAMVLTVIAGSDPLDPATAEADARKVDYRAALDADSLRGARIGVMRFLVPNYSAETQAVFEASLQAMRDAGAELVEITEAPEDYRAIGGWELTVLLTELKHDLNAYLATTDPAQVKTRTLADVIAFNAAEPRETVLFGQDLFERAEATGGLTDPAYVEARDRSFRAAGPEGIDRMMAEHGVIALTAPTTSRAWTNDPDDDDRSQGSASRLAAVAGYPHLTVPMGFDRGMPVGISFIGGQWDDATVLSLGYAFEQRTRARRAPVRP